MKFAARSHANQRRDSGDGPFIEHPVEVARLLRDAGCPDIVIVAGLLHDVLEKTHTELAELTARFGTEVADLVQAVSDDASIRSYRQRKQRLREQVHAAGGDAALIFAADKISKLLELPDRIADDRARYGIAPTHPLITRLASELRACAIATALPRTTAPRERRR